MGAGLLKTWPPLAMGVMKMKPTFLRLALVAAALGLPASDGRTQLHFDDPALKPEITLKLQNATLDDYLVELGRTANINIFADATHFPAAPESISGEWTLRVGDFLWNSAAKRKHTMLRQGERTFLFWTEPDSLGMAQRIAAGQSIEMIGGAPSDRIMARLMMEYLQREHKWNGLTPGFSLRMKLGDLPPDLRAPTIAWTQANLLPPTLMPSLKAWVRDEFWQHAWVQIMEIGVGLGKPKEVDLMVAGKVENKGEPGQTLVRLDKQVPLAW